LIEIYLINKTTNAIYSDSGHVKCQHAMLTHEALTTVGQKECTIYFIQFSLKLQSLKKFQPSLNCLFH